MAENVTTLLNSTSLLQLSLFLENSSMIFRQIEAHYHLMMLSICDLGTFVFNFLVRLHPSLKGKKLEKLLED